MKALKFILKLKNYKIVTYSLLGLGLIALLPISVLWIQHQTASANTQANSNFLSPMADQQTLKEIPATETTQSLNYYLSLAGSFLEKATRMANDNPQQTEVDRLKIINTLNEALKAANQAVKYYPNQPAGYLVRSKVFKRTTKIWPETEKLAQKDLKTAKALINNPETTEQELLTKYLPDKETSPLNFIPAQQAKIAQNVTIATADEENNQLEADSDTQTNSLSGEADLLAGKTEITVKAPNLKAEDMVYVLPQSNPENKTLSVKAKSAGNWFKVGLNSLADQDMKFDWWIISAESAD